MYRHVWEKPSGRKTVGCPGLSKDDDGRVIGGYQGEKVDAVECDEMKDNKT